MRNLLIRLIILCSLSELMSAEGICVKVTDPAGLPLWGGEFQAFNLKSPAKSIPLSKSSQPAKAYYCVEAPAGDILKLTISVRGFITITLEDVKVLKGINRELIQSMQFQEMSPITVP